MRVLSAEEMPESNADLAAVQVEFPRLRDDSAASCPLVMDDLLGYLALEVPGGERLAADDLTFIRTAVVADTSYWIWKFNEPDGGDPAYATVAIGEFRMLGYETDYYGLSAEQFILGDYHNVF